MSTRITGLLFIGALIFYLVFNAAVVITDPVESNYALTAKEMVLSGDWLSPQIYGQYWFDKPIMIYWLIAISYKIFGIGEFAARFPSAVFSAASVAFTHWFAGKLFASRRAALLSALALGTSLGFWVLARMVITDAVLFFFNSVSLAAFYYGLKSRAFMWYILAYGAAGLAVLTKGPVGLVLPGIIVFMYIIVTRQWKLIGRLFIFRGLFVFALITVPWYGMMYKVHGKVFIDTFLGLHNYIRATVSEHPKDNVFYYYLVLFPVSILPWAGILFKTIIDAFRGRTFPAFSYLAVWVGTTIGFYTLMATKYPTYVFPATFPAALLIGHCMSRMQDRAGRKVWLWLTFPALILYSIVGIGCKFLPNMGGGMLVAAVAIVIVAVIVVLWWQIKGDMRRFPMIVASATMVLSLTLIYCGFIPLAQLRSAKTAAQNLPPSGAVVGSYGEYPTSAVFYSGYNMPWLVADLESLNMEDAWAGKNVMPIETIASFAERTKNYPETYILDKSQRKLFEKEPLAKEFIPLFTYKETTLYKRK